MLLSTKMHQRCHPTEWYGETEKRKREFGEKTKNRTADNMSLAHEILYKPTITDIQMSREQSLVSNVVSSKLALNCCPPKFVLFARTATQTLV